MVLDCADGCTTAVTATGSLYMCEMGGETSCTDGADNDADMLIDCLDPSCDGAVINASSGAECEHTTEVTCDDG